MLWKRPILIGGLGLSATLWLLETVQINFLDSSTLFSAMAIGSGVWWWRRRADRSAVAAVSASAIAPANLEQVQRSVEAVNRAIDELEKRISDPSTATKGSCQQPQVSALRQRALDLLPGLARRQLAIAIVGESSTGKTQLLHHLDRHAWIGEAPTFTELSLPLAATAVDPQDACLWLTAGDITDSTFQALQQRVLLGQQTVLVLNKQDHYRPQDRDLILQRLEQRVQALPRPVPVVAIAAQPQPLTVRRHQPDGTVQESLEPSPAILEPLMALVQQQLQTQAPTLVMATTLRQAQALYRDVHTALNQLRRQQAMPLVEQMQWLAAASAFASPVPTLDLLATVAINGQLIVDLGKIYGFSFSVEEAKTAASTLAQLMVKLGLVEVSTQALGTLLKSHVTTYVAGGLVQGLSAAYLTRMAGQSLIDYFEAAALAQQPRSALSLEAVGQHLQRLIQPGQQAAFLSGLVQQGLDRLRPDRPNPLPTDVDAAIAPASI